MSRAALNDMGQSQIGNLGGFGSLREERERLGSFYLAEQVKFSVLQSLVLIELAITSSSRVVFTLCGCGVFLVWFFTILLRDDKVSESLAYFYPLLVMSTTTLLSVITLVKVFFVEEQVDLSLVFLGVGFTSDNILLIKEVVRTNAKFSLSVGGSARAQEAVPGARGSVASVEDGLKKPGRFQVLNIVQDWFVSGILIAVVIVAHIVCAAHAVITAPIGFFLDKFVMDPLFARWVTEEDTKRRELSSVGIIVSSCAESGRSTEVRKATTKAIMYYVTVVIVDLEFLAIAIAMAEITGGARVGGQPINSNLTSC